MRRRPRDTSGSVIARTRRLLIRRVAADDLDAMHDVYSDADAMRWVGDGSPLDRAGCARWIEITLANYARRGYGMYAVELAATGAVAGFCGIVHPNDQPEAEVKYALRRVHWGSGIASEAVQGLLRYAFDTLALPELIATTAPENAASQRVLRRAGFAEIEPRVAADGSCDRVFRVARPA